jgi:Ca2+-binding RTX toxin-like protein
MKHFSAPERSARPKEMPSDPPSGTPVGGKSDAGAEGARPLGISLVVLGLVAAATLFVATVAFGGTSEVISGQGTLRGTETGDRVLGSSGADTMYGLSGGDFLLGGDGPDNLHGGPGRDALLGGPGDDTIYARDGERDYVGCGPGDDMVRADTGDLVEDACEVVRRG